MQEWSGDPVLARGAAEFAIPAALPAYTPPPGSPSPPLPPPKGSIPPPLHCTQHLVLGASFIMIIPLLPPQPSFIFLRRKLGSRFLVRASFQQIWYWSWKVYILAKVWKIIGWCDFIQLPLALLPSWLLSDRTTSTIIRSQLLCHVDMQDAVFFI